MISSLENLSGEWFLLTRHDLAEIKIRQNLHFISWLAEGNDQAKSLSGL